MHSGWFKFHRQIFDNPVCTKDAEHFFVWVWILNEANYEDGRRVFFKNEETVLQKGQLMTTIKIIVNELHISKGKVERILKLLESEKQIEKQSSNKNTLITVLNWEKYQYCDTQNEKRVGNGRETNRKRMGNQQETDEKQIGKEWETSGKPSYYNKELKKERSKEDEEIKEMKNGRKEEDVITVSKETVCQTQDVRRVFEAWNELESYGIKSISRLSSSSQRYQRLNGRIKEYGIDDVLAAIDKIRESEFLRGKNNKGWVITFDWFVCPNNFPKVLDGNYDRKNTITTRADNINANRQSQLSYLLNSIKEDEMNDGNRN